MVVVSYMKKGKINTVKCNGNGITGNNTIYCAYIDIHIDVQFMQWALRTTLFCRRRRRRRGEIKAGRHICY